MIDLIQVRRRGAAKTGQVGGRVCQEIWNHPHVRFRAPVKRVFLDRFPFAVVYFEEREVVTVVAVEALKKQPGYWRSRLRSH